MKDPSGKGKRLIILHIDSDSGFVEGVLLCMYVCMESVKNSDYHEEMNAEVFKKWFENIVGKLEEGSVIVMDNATYHSRKLVKVPTTAWRKGEIVEWLREKNISFENNMVKAELLGIVRRYKETVDEIAKTVGHVILCLPPYHCDLTASYISSTRKRKKFRLSKNFTLFDNLNIFINAHTRKDYKIEKV